MQGVILVGDTRAVLPTLDAGSVRCCVTSPPYFGLRDYGHDGQIGLEHTPDAYVAELVAVFREVRRVLADDGTLWLNLGDSYSFSGRGGGGKQDTNVGSAAAGPTDVDGIAPKNLLGIPWRVAFTLQADGWYLRSDIIWAKPNPMPESVRDRPTKSHEHLFLLAKSPRYFYDAAAIAEPSVATDLHNQTGTCRTGIPGQPDQTGNRAQKKRTVRESIDTNGGGQGTGTMEYPAFIRNKRDVWTIPTQPFPGAHFAVMPEARVEPCFLAGSAPGDTVLDPFAGAGTVGLVALRHRREFVGVELNEEYAEMARRRMAEVEVTLV